MAETEHRVCFHILIEDGRMNTQGAHQPFCADLCWSEFYWCENISRGISASQALGAKREPGCPAVQICWMECICWLPSESANCPIGKMQHPTAWQIPSAWSRPFGIALEPVWLSKVHHGAGSRTEREREEKLASSSYAWVWWAVLSCLPKKWDDATMKMFLCLYSTPEENLSLGCQVTEDKLN